MFRFSLRFAGPESPSSRTRSCRPRVGVVDVNSAAHPAVAAPSRATLDGVTFVLGVISGVLGTLILALFEPVQRWLARLGRRLLRSDGLQVHVESDPAIIWAGLPDWQGFFFYVPHHIRLPEPPRNPRRWHAWITDLGGWDLHESIVRLTIVATAPTTIVLETPVLEAKGRALPEGRKVIHAVGGADLRPREFHVDLDMFGLASPDVTLVDGDGDAQALPRSYSLKKDDVEVFLLRVSSQESQLISWNARLPILIDGRRKFVDITDADRDFLLAGGDLLGRRLVWNCEWQAEDL